MGARESLQRLVDKKTQEIDGLEREIERARIYVQAIQDSIKTLPRENTPNVKGDEPATLRPGTALARARDAIQKNGKPMPIDDLLVAIGSPITKSAKVSLIGSLGGYVRKKTIFTRPAPNTFGLVAIPHHGTGAGPQLPDDFGEVSGEGVKPVLGAAAN